ncbi:MAG: homoserine kinase type II, partial [Candidatus Azotimanducaceae bacterium]
CRIIGKLLADIHAASNTANYDRANPYHNEWSWETLEAKKGELANTDYSMLEETLRLHAKVLSNPLDLPRGIIHGDLFMDNTMFEGDKLTGVIDFYHACEDYLIQDVSIALLVWCTDADGTVNQSLSQSLLTGYESVRAFTEDEKNLLPVFCRSAASRFALTRLISGEGQGYLKDPQEFLNILRRLE